MASTPPPPPPLPPLRSPLYNLQIYGYNGVRSPHFPPNTCGNKWLNLYNACPATGGIGHCGKWDTTVDDMVRCGLQSDPAIPWKNHSSSKEHAREAVLQDFCECISCAFLPAVRDNATLSVPRPCDKDTPSLKAVVEQLAIELCGVVAPNSLEACSSGFKWSAKAKCESGEASCAEYTFTLGLASVADFDAAAQLDFLGRLAGLARVPLESLYVKSVRPGSVVATVGVYETYAPQVAAVTTGGGSDPAGGPPVGAVDRADLSAAVGVPVESVIASGSNSGVGGGGGGGGGASSLLTGASNGRVAAAIVLPFLFVAICLILGWRWSHDRCRGVREQHAGAGQAATATAAVVSVEKSSSPPPPPPKSSGGGEEAGPADAHADAVAAEEAEEAARDESGGGGGGKDDGKVEVV